MKFEIDRISWHYRFNNYVRSNYNKQYFEEAYPDFCSYWRITVFNLFVASADIILLLGALGLVIYLIFSEPFALMTILGMAFVIQYLIGLGVKRFARFLENRDTKTRLKQTKEQRESLFKQKLYSWKHKICTTISYK